MNFNNPYGQQMSPTEFMYPIINSQFENNQRLPVLGELSYDRLVKTIYDSIVAEATAAKFYTKLLDLAPNEIHREIIKYARNNELKHIESLTMLYVRLVGHIPHVKLEPIQISNYKAGILTALKAEIEAVDLYRDVQLVSMNPVIREPFYRAMVNKMEHANQFGEIYHSLS
ncbi:rubrerythrin [Lysinibacillus composti]|uniref:Ferritin-like domain-containing protein n=1 Tax=Lysinibacillus composti TaxID=720633 RepID=A0A3N9UI56_9BACI|nr:ferritin-like domain-containing protein [Lysinibacillus composti]MBM7607768.1 rubrerythrin [Lysinibacillus composti]RQW75740.1 ferritin-like domain-containing protein [Lysinibacillus composti]